MGLIAIATAWSGFQAAKWGGQMSNSYAAANVARSHFLLNSITAQQQVALDVQIFINWVNAFAVEDELLADFYFERMRDEAKPAIEAWIATKPLENPDAPSNPFVMEEYSIAKNQEAAANEAEAIALSQRALTANQTSDNYVLTTVILASGLFFAGIASRLRNPRTEFAVMIVALAALGYGVFNIATYPILL